MENLGKSCSAIRQELVTAKNDLGNVSSSLVSIQHASESVVEKLNKFSIRMYDMENQSSLLLKVYILTVKRHGRTIGSAN